MFIKRIKRILNVIYFFLHERKYQGRLKYVFFNNRSERLVIVFSGFPGNNKPAYNYIRTLKKVKADKLFILDDFGFKGSYYLLENGTNKPQLLVQSLIENIVKRKKGYVSTAFAGSSKGGTAAIFYGLQYQATDIYAGACQYYIGDYLCTPDHAPIVFGMTGRNPTPEIRKDLNEIMPKQLKKYAGVNTVIHILYSKKEHTYNEHIEGLISDLGKYNITVVENEEYFTNHSDVGRYFSPYLKQELL